MTYVIHVYHCWRVGKSLAVIRRDGCALESELMAFATLLHRERSSVGARIRTRKPRHLVLRFVVGIFSFVMNFVARQKRFVGAIRENKVAQEKRRIPDGAKRVNHVLPVAGRGVARVFRPRQTTHSGYQQNQQYPNLFHLRTVFKTLDRSRCLTSNASVSTRYRRPTTP